MESNFLRHYIATIVYRLDKAIKNAPDIYPYFKIGNGVRSPVEILSLISFVLTCAHSVFHNYDCLEEPEVSTWEVEIKRFYDIIEKLDKAISAGLPQRERVVEKLLQGPLSDAMTHIGQLSMLRRMANDPLPKENFFDANIEVKSFNSLMDDDSLTSI
jgi:hypothetical protein